MEPNEPTGRGSPNPGSEQLSEQRLALKVQAIREAIDRNGRLTVRFRGFERLILPHRLWLQDDGTFLLEAFQVSGGSEWGDIGDENFSRSPMGGWEGWINFPAELLETVAPGGGPFEAHPEYNPDPKRRLGDVDRQVQARRRDNRAG